MKACAGRAEQRLGERGGYKTMHSTGGRVLVKLAAAGPPHPRAQGIAGSQRRGPTQPPPRGPPRPRSAPSPPRPGPQTAPSGGANGREEGGSGLGAHRDFPRRARPDKDPRPPRGWRMRPRPPAAAAGSLAPCR